MKTQKMHTFYTLVVTQTFSLIGSQLSSLALGIWVYNKTGNATPLALVAFFGIVPRVVLSNVAGLLADRWDRRYVMALSDFGQALGTVLLLILFASGLFQIWHLYLVTAVQALFAVFQQPAFDASVTMLVPEESRERANAIRQMTHPTAGIIAPALAGLVFAVSGVMGAIVIDLLTFVVAVTVVLRLHIPMPRKTQVSAELSGDMWHEMLAGFRYLWQRQVLFWVMMYIMLINFLLNIAGVLFTPYLLARTGDEMAYGFILSLFNAGMLVGSIVIGIWGGTRPRVHTIMPSAIMLSVCVVLIGTARSIPALAVLVFLMMVPNAFINVLFISMLQSKIAPDVQGRVFAVTEQFAMMMSPIGMLIAGPLADKLFEPMVGQAGWQRVAPLVGNEAGAGMGLIFVIAGLLSMVASFIMYAHPAVRRMEQTLPDYEVHAVDEEELSPQFVTV